jgi:glutamate N-acetyltransferase/amino-acid N-acetyltransferase
VTVTAPAGFVAGGIAAGIKPDGRLDLGLVSTSDGTPAVAGAVFTTNRATAAPVQVSRAHIEATAGRAAAVVLNSGNANAATGRPGLDAAEAMCRLTAEGVGCRPAEVLVCSTGLIGVPFPADTVLRAIPDLVASRSDDGGGRAAEAIMTTDTHPKEVLVPGPGFTVGGMAKGAAMLAPHMATMLAVLTTDAVVEPPALRRALAGAVARSFNLLSTDGCTSTNDTVVVLASGGCGVAPDEAELTAALWEACADLAGQMAADAEGATKVVRVRVVGAASAEEAASGARRVAESQLVKCSLYGEDPYWGRILSELGSAGIAFDLDRASVSYGGIAVCRSGVAATGCDRAALAQVMAGRTVEVVADLGLGPGEASVLTADLGPGYIDENMRTS